MPWRGRLAFRQYIPSKRHWFGVKLFVLCNVNPGYYSCEHILKELGLTGSVVVELLGDFLGRGHTLFIDIWYTNPALFQFLHSRQTSACGMVRINRRGFRSSRRSFNKVKLITFTWTPPCWPWSDVIEVMCTCCRQCMERSLPKQRRWTGGQGKRSQTEC